MSDPEELRRQLRHACRSIVAGAVITGECAGGIRAEYRQDAIGRWRARWWRGGERVPFRELMLRS